MDKLVIPKGSVLVGETVLISHQGDVIIEGDVQPRGIRSVHGSITYAGSGKHCETLTAETGSVKVSGASFSCNQIVAGEADLNVDDLKVTQSLAVGNQLNIRSKSADIPSCIGGDMEIQSDQFCANKVEAKGHVKLFVEGAKIKRLEADKLLVKGSLECKKLIAREMVMVESGHVAIKYLDTPSFQASPEVTGVVMVATTKDVRAEGVRGFLHPSELGFLSQDEGEGEVFSTGTFEIATQDLPSFDDSPTTLDEDDLDEVEADDTQRHDGNLEQGHADEDQLDEAHLVETDSEDSESHDADLDDTNPDSTREPLVPGTTDEYQTKMVESDVEDWATRLTDDSSDEEEETDPEIETVAEGEPAAGENAEEDSSVFIEELSPEDLDSASLEELSEDLDDVETDAKDEDVAAGAPARDPMDSEPFQEEIDSLTAANNESAESEATAEPEKNYSGWDAETVGITRESLADSALSQERPAETEVSNNIEDTHPSDEWVPDDSPNATEFEIVGRDPLDMSIPAIVPMEDSSDQLEGEIEVSSEDFADVEELEEVSATDLEPEVSIQDADSDEPAEVSVSAQGDWSEEAVSNGIDEEESSLSLDDLGDPLEDVESAESAEDPLGSDELLEVVEEAPEASQETVEEYMDVDSGDLEELPDPLEDSALEIPDPQEDFDVLDEADILEEEEDPEDVVISDLTDILNRIQAYFPEDNYPQFINQIHRYLEERRLNLFVKASNRRAVLSSFDKFGHDEICRLARSFFERLDLFFEEQNA